MRGERIFAGLVVGLLLGLFGYLPLVLLWQHFADVPQPQLYPNRSFTSFGPNPPPLTYWISWAAPAAVFVLLGLMTIPSRTGRQFAIAIGARVPSGRGNGGVVLDLDGTVLQPH